MILYTQRATSLVDLLTVHYHLHTLDKTMDDLEDLCYGLTSLVLRQSVQPLDHGLHFLLANKFPNQFFFIHKSGKRIPSPTMGLLSFPCFISLVVDASVESSSRRILTTISFMASVGGISV